MTSTKAALVPADRATAMDKLIAEEQMKEARFQDVTLILQNLFEREEATVKLILDSLLDVGVVNLVENKVGPRPLRGPLKSVLGMSKPMVRFVAIRWFQKNCPELIVNWLRTQVSFSNKG